METIKKILRECDDARESLEEAYNSLGFEIWRHIRDIAPEMQWGVYWTDRGPRVWLGLHPLRATTEHEYYRCSLRIPSCLRGYVGMITYPSYWGMTDLHNLVQRLETICGDSHGQD